VGRDSAVGIGTHYGPDGTGFESGWVQEIFFSRHMCKLLLAPTHPLLQRYRGCFPEVKRPGRGVDHPPLFRTDVKNE
jgi:hypothetical protein